MGRLRMRPWHPGAGGGRALGFRSSQDYPAKTVTTVVPFAAGGPATSSPAS